MSLFADVASWASNGFSASLKLLAGIAWIVAFVCGLLVLVWVPGAIVFWTGRTLVGGSQHVPPMPGRRVVWTIAVAVAVSLLTCDGGALFVSVMASTVLLLPLCFYEGNRWRFVAATALLLDVAFLMEPVAPTTLFALAVPTLIGIVLSAVSIWGVPQLRIAA